MPKTESDKTPDPFAWEPATADWSWSQIVRRAMAELGGEAQLAALYAFIERHPRADGRKHVRAKVRQCLGRSSEYARVAPGVWAFSSRYSASDLRKLEEARRERYRKREG